MGWKEFFKLTKVKIIYLIVIAIVIIISGSLASNVMYCFIAPCNQKTSTIVGQKIYSVVTFNFNYLGGDLSHDFSYINTHSAVKVKNFLRDTLHISAGTAYRSISFIIGMIIHYFLISVIIHGIDYFRSKPAGKKETKTPPV
jgi:hypothetical protein